MQLPGIHRNKYKNTEAITYTAKKLKGFEIPRIKRGKKPTFPASSGDHTHA